MPPRASSRFVRLFVVAAALLLAGSPLTLRGQTPTSGQYHITQRFTLGVEGGWDYLSVDTARGRLFIARTDRFMVVDPLTGKLIGEIPGLKKGHGVAFDYASNHGFVTSGADSLVTMFDLTTLTVIKKITAADDDDAILYDPATKHIFTMNGDANSSSVIDPATGTSIGTIPLTSLPEFGVSDRTGKVYANLLRGEVVEIDAQRMVVSRQWSTAPCRDATGLAIDTAHHRLFSACRNKLLVVSDIQRGKVVTTLPIGGAVDAAVYDPMHNEVLTSNGDGTITVIHQDTPDTYRVVATIQTLPGARTMTLDPKTHRLYTVAALLGPVSSTTSAVGTPRRAPMIPGSFTLLVLER